MFKKGAAITFIFIISTAIQLLSQIIITRIYGASLTLDTFLAAVAIPTILVTVIYGTVNDAFLPLYGEEKTKNPEHSDQYFFSHVLSLTICFFIAAVALMLCSDQLSQWFYNSRGEEFVSSVANQMRFMMLSIPLALIATMLGSYFYSHKQFIRFPVAQAVGSLINILIIFALAETIGITALIIGFVVNIFFQILFVIPTKLHAIDFKFGNIAPFFIAWIPVVIGSIALRSDALLIRSFGAHLPEGYLVYLNLISKIFSLATGVLTIGIQVLLLPHLVEHIAKKEYETATTMVFRAKIIAIGISIVATVLLALISPLAIKLIFVGGNFTEADANIAIMLIPYFVIPAIGWGINSIFFQPLLALKKQKELGLLNLAALGLAWGTAYVVEIYVNPMLAIICGLSVLLFTGIIGSEMLWQTYKKQLKP